MSGRKSGMSTTCPRAPPTSRPASGPGKATRSGTRSGARTMTAKVWKGHGRWDAGDGWQLLGLLSTRIEGGHASNSSPAFFPVVTPSTSSTRSAGGCVKYTNKWAEDTTEEGKREVRGWAFFPELSGHGYSCGISFCSGLTCAQAALQCGLQACLNKRLTIINLFSLR